MPRSIFGEEPQGSEKKELSSTRWIWVATVLVAAIFFLGVWLGGKGPTKSLNELQARYSTLEKQYATEREGKLTLEKEVTDLKNQLQSRKPVAKLRTKRQAGSKRKKSRQ